MKFLNLSTNLNADKKQKLLSFFSYFSINCFILWYFFVVITWLCSNNFSVNTAANGSTSGNGFNHAISEKLTPMTKLIGLDQIWAVFSPKVRTENQHNLVVITLQNGFLKLCEMPRMERLGLLEKMQREKFRKLFNDNFPYQKILPMRPALSRFLASAAYSKYNPPSRISYFLISEPIDPPEEIFGQVIKKDLHPTIANYFVYGVSPDDFK